MLCMGGPLPLHWELCCDQTHTEHFYLQSPGLQSQCRADSEGAGVPEGGSITGAACSVLLAFFQPQTPWQVAEG